MTLDKKEVVFINTTMIKDVRIKKSLLSLSRIIRFLSLFE